MNRARRLRRSSARDGFTILELMAVLTIIGISAALAAPEIARVIAQRRASEGMYSAVRAGALARTEAITYGRAHAVGFFENSAGSYGNLGRLEVWRGRVNRCALNNWAAIVTADCASSVDCRDAVDLDSFASSSYATQMRAQGNPNLWICYEPDGTTLVSTSGAGGPYSTAVPGGNDGVRVLFQRLKNGVPEGVVREAVFPLGGAPRVNR